MTSFEKQNERDFIPLRFLVSKYFALDPMESVLAPYPGDGGAKREQVFPSGIPSWVGISYRT